MVDRTSSHRNKTKMKARKGEYDCRSTIKIERRILRRRGYILDTRLHFSGRLFIRHVATCQLIVTPDYHDRRDKPQPCV
jgi:hypothetical protein